MAEDDPDRAVTGELAAWLARHLGGMPPPMPVEDAAALFIADMERAITAYRQDDQMGVGAALTAAARLCHALGRPLLTGPFTELGRGLLDLVEGKPTSPRIFRARATAQGNPKERQQWSLEASVCSFLDVLIKDAKMQRDKAAADL